MNGKKRRINTAKCKAGTVLRMDIDTPIRGGGETLYLRLSGDETEGEKQAMAEEAFFYCCGYSTSTISEDDVPEGKEIIE